MGGGTPALKGAGSPGEAGEERTRKRASQGCGTVRNRKTFRKHPRNILQEQKTKTREPQLKGGGGSRESKIRKAGSTTPPPPPLLASFPCIVSMSWFRAS